MRIICEQCATLYNSDETAHCPACGFGKKEIPKQERKRTEKKPKVKKEPKPQPPDPRTGTEPYDSYWNEWLAVPEGVKKNLSRAGRKNLRRKIQAKYGMHKPRVSWTMRYWRIKKCKKCKFCKEHTPPTKEVEPLYP